MWQIHIMHTKIHSSERDKNGVATDEYVYVVNVSALTAYKANTQDVAATQGDQR